MIIGKTVDDYTCNKQKTCKPSFTHPKPQPNFHSIKVENILSADATPTGIVDNIFKYNLMIVISITARKGFNNIVGTFIKAFFSNYFPFLSPDFLFI